MPMPSPILESSTPPSEGDRKQRDLAESGASVESTPPKKRRRFSASEKLRLLKAAEAALASGERGALNARLAPAIVRLYERVAASTTRTRRPSVLGAVRG